MKFFHGTSSANLKSILKNGFVAPCYFTTSLDDAQYYAATGGEESLHLREEEYEDRTGVNAREHFEPDFWEMYQHLYPKGSSPIVLVLDIPEHVLASSKKDSGAQDGIVFNKKISAEFILETLSVTWPS
jgi:hypothetical protein